MRHPNKREKPMSFRIKLILFISIYFMPFLGVFAEKTIYIYGGDGVGEDAFIHTKLTLRAVVNPRYNIEEIDASEVIKGKWKDDAILFVMPGGRDQRYDELLKGAGNKQISSFVNSGGKFLAICGAAYYGGQEMEFAKGTREEIAGSRELGFFPGLIRGPAFGGIWDKDKNPSGYNYRIYTGARAMPIKWNVDGPFDKDTVFPVFYNGGPYFVNAEAFSDRVKVLATYQIDEQPSVLMERLEDEPRSSIASWIPEPKSAIVECSVGRGTAILSAVHPEFSPYFLRKSNIYLQKIYPSLFSANQERQILMEFLLNHLDIETHKVFMAKL
jgi:biotin--protein ligase